MNAIFIAVVIIPGVAQKPPVRLPPIAKFLGIEVGRTTREELERRWGKGQELTGGHPRGARFWYVPELQLAIHADGFDYARGGMLLDGIRVERGQVEGLKFKRARIPARDHRLWGGSIRWGMDRAAFLSVLKAKQWRWSENGATVIIKQKGMLDYRGIASEVSLTYSVWEAQFSFQQGLDSIWIQAG